MSREPKILSIVPWIVFGCITFITFALFRNDALIVARAELHRLNNIADGIANISDVAAAADSFKDHSDPNAIPKMCL